MINKNITKKVFINKIILIVTALLISAMYVMNVQNSSVNAGGGPAAGIEFTPDVPSALANGTAKINISTYSFWYKCNDNNYGSTLAECDTKGGFSGVKITVSSETTSISGDAGLTLSTNSITSNAGGNASFNVTATTPGNYNIYAKTYTGYVLGQKSVTFTDPNPAPAPTPTPTTTTKKPTTTETTQKTQTTPTQEKPPTPEVKLVNSEGNPVQKEENAEVISFEENEPIILSGQTVPNGVVKLYIFSEPQEAEVTADENGNWTYTISSIEPGDHRVESEVTDPATGLTSDRTEVLAFQVASTDIAQTTSDTEMTTSVDTDSDKSILPVIIAGLIIIILAASAGGYLVMRHRKKKATNSPLTTEEKQLPTESIQPNDTTQSDN